MRRGRRGFTLIELSIYIGLSTVVVGAVLAVETVVRRSTIRQGLQLAVNEDRVRIGDRFRQDVGHALAAKAAADGQSLVLVPAPGVEAVRYRFEGGRLLRQAGNASPQPLGRLARVGFLVKPGGLVLLEGDLLREVPGPIRVAEPLRLAGVTLGSGR